MPPDSQMPPSATQSQQNRNGGQKRLHDPSVVRPAVDGLLSDDACHVRRQIQQKMTSSLQSVGKITLSCCTALKVIDIDIKIDVEVRTTVAQFERPIDDGARICRLPHILAARFDS